jgi:tRNA dimethylallyltransferase
MAKADNNKQVIKIVAILGPTSTGKSDLAVFLAKRFNGEVISADSRQVYKGMNLGTGKITKREMQKVPHHMLDIASPRSAYNASRFKQDAEKAILNIVKRGRLPIIAGGTGFWLDSLIFSQNFPDVSPDPKLRATLEKLPTAKLFAMLKKLDPKRTKNIDPKNPRRLIRAIEVAKAKPKTKLKERAFILEPLFIGLDLPTERLYSKIDERLEKRFKKGMIAEVKRLKQQGLSWKRLEGFGLEYRAIAQFLQSKQNMDEMKKLLSYAIKHYAKRQRTWFKRNKAIHWFNPEKAKTLKEAEKITKKFLS